MAAVDTPPRTEHAFASTQSVCHTTLLREYGSFNLMEDIRSQLIDEIASTDVVLIRRMATDQMYPYHAATFLQWWVQEKTDPMTRESLEYISKYVEMQCQALSNLKAPQPSLCSQIVHSDTMPPGTASLLCEYIVSHLVPQKIPHAEYCECDGIPDDDKSIRYRYLLDVAVWEKAGYLSSPEISRERCAELIGDMPVGSFTIRKSSLHNVPGVMMRNSECVSFTVRKTTGETRHIRTVHVFGVGWFFAITNRVRTDSFANFSKDLRCREPLCASFVEVIEHLLVTYRLKWKDHVVLPAGSAQMPRQQ